MENTAKLGAPEASYEHCKQFEPVGITQVTDGVYHALGYGVANIVFLEGPESLIAIDTLENEGLAERVIKDLRKITQKPISDVIFTHSHGDHMGGTGAFLKEARHPPEIWAHASLARGTYYETAVMPRIHAGIIWQFAALSDPDEVVHNGIGPNCPLLWKNTKFTAIGAVGFSPTRLVHGEREDVTIAGLELSLLHLPGETDDHLCVWWPEKGALMPGDNIYHCFPSLYPVRGAPPRNPLNWADSLQTIKSLKPRFLCPGHTKPVCGENEIEELLDAYTAGIRFVHDQTVRHLNLGLHPNEIVRRVRLPPSLADHPNLQEHYGTIAQGVKSICVGHLGWFSGVDLLELSPMVPQERASRLVGLVGRDKMVAEADAALKTGDLWWAVELATYVLRDGDDAKATTIRKEALRKLAERQTSSHMRCAYLTFALDSWDIKKVLTNFRDVVLKSPAPHIFMALRVRVHERADKVNATLSLHLTDRQDGGHYSLSLKHAVLNVHGAESENWDIRLEASTDDFRKYLLGVKDAAKVTQDAEVTFEGQAELFGQFMNSFDLS